MILLNNLTTEKLDEISTIVAESFMSSEGVLTNIMGNNYEEKVYNAKAYFGELVNICYNANCLYATSEKHEGYGAFYSKKNSDINFKNLTLSLFNKMDKQVLRQLSKLLSTVHGYERMYASDDDIYVILLVVVKTEYQGKGFMRKIVEFAFNEGKKQKLTCVLDTDFEQKAKKYEHLGMKIVNTSEIEELGSWFTMCYEDN